MVRAVIFDMDGTLIDTERYYRIFWRQALEEYGYQVTEDQILSLRSLGRPYAPRRLREWFGEDFDYTAVRERRKELMEQGLKRDGIKCKPGARELLQYLRERRVITAVATATDPERTKRYLNEVALEGFFDRLISATQVERGKPAPDIYLYACKQLGCLPKECIAVEDSPNGVLSAYRAGCKVVMVPDQTTEEEVSEYLYGSAVDLEGVKEYL